MRKRKLFTNPTPKPIQDALTAMRDSPWFDYLWQRWQDESEYEDFDDYARHVEKEMPGFKVERSFPKSFAFTLSHEDMPGARYKIWSTRESGWVREA